MYKYVAFHHEKVEIFTHEDDKKAWLYAVKLCKENNLDVTELELIRL